MGSGHMQTDRKMKFHLLLWALFALSALSVILINVAPRAFEKPTAEPESHSAPRRPAMASRTYLV